MGVNEGVSEEAGTDTAESGKQLKQEGITGNIVGNAECDIAASLGQVQAQTGVAATVKLGVYDPECMAWRQCAGLCIAGRPGRYNHAAAHWVVLQLID